jgi:type II secretory pathway component GspD/PulD (secretin)
MKLRTIVSAKNAITMCCSGPAARRGCALVLLALLVLFVTWGPAATSAGAAGRFSLDFIDSDLIDVYKALSTQSGVNIVLTSGVQGKTTLSLRNVTLEEALRLVSASNGLEYTWVDVAYVVGKPEEVRGLRVKELVSRAVALRQVTPKYAQEVLSQAVPQVSVSYQEGFATIVLIGTESDLVRAERSLAEIDVPSPPTSRMFGLSHAKAETVAGLLETAVPEAAVQVGPQENALVVTADGVRMAQAEALIRAVDVVPGAGQAYTTIYKIKYANAEELKKTITERFPDLTCIDAPRSHTPVIQQASATAGVTTSMLAAPQTTGGSGVSGTTAGVAGAQVEVARIERLILMGAEYTVQKALALLEEIDVPSKQVKIRAVISRVNRDALRQLGIDWGATFGATDASFVPIGITERGADDRSMRVGGFTRSPLDFSGKLRALETQGSAKLLSEPSVLTLDGRQVAFHSGDKIFFETLIGYGTQGTPIYDIREIDVGVTLVVTPQVHPNGEITMTLAPSFSSASQRPELGTSLPVVNERSAIASVRVKQGESVVIAGLVEDDVRSSTTKLPILGDIPILGHFFKHTKKQHIQDELVILVSPEVVE